MVLNQKAAILGFELGAGQDMSHASGQKLGSYASLLIVETISSVENVLINSRREGIFFTPAQDELESSNLRMSQKFRPRVRASFISLFYTSLSFVQI
jgi:hypothetical protein